jgi:hypothetical protein
VVSPVVIAKGVPHIFSASKKALDGIELEKPTATVE